MMKAWFWSKLVNTVHHASLLTSENDDGTGTREMSMREGNPTGAHIPPIQVIMKTSSSIPGRAIQRGRPWYTMDDACHNVPRGGWTAWVCMDRMGIGE